MSNKYADILKQFDELFGYGGAYNNDKLWEVDGDIKQFIADKLEARDEKWIKALGKIEELHTHDSIPCLTGEENNGCITCIKNKALKEILTKMEK